VNEYMSTLLVDLRDDLSEGSCRLLIKSNFMRINAIAVLDLLCDSEDDEAPSPVSDTSNIEDIETGLVETEDDVDSIQALLGDIKDIVDRLYRLAARLRNPTTRALPSIKNFHRLTYKTSDGQDVPLTKEERRLAHKQCEMLHSRRIEDIVRQSFKKIDTSLDDDLDIPTKDLIRRIGCANAYRQQQFIFWREREQGRRDRLATSISHSAPISNRKSPYADIPLAPAQDTENRKITFSEPLSHTWELPNEVLAQPHLVVEDSRSEISNSARTNTPTIYEPGGKKVGWPDFPKELEGRGPFICPYCFVTCPASYRGKAHWR